MEVRDYGAMGQTVIVSPIDKLSRMPRSHRDLITDDVRAVFQDAPGYFSRIAERTPFRRMAEWLRALVRENRWSLVLHGGFGSGRAGFKWSSETVIGAEIGLPQQQDAPSLPDPLAALFRLVGFVDWSGYYEGGGRISWPEWLLFWPAENGGTRVSGSPIDWGNSLTWGGFNGDVLFATPDDRAGWLGLSREVKMLGTVADAINWWFAMLLVGSSPTMDRVAAA